MISAGETEVVPAWWLTYSMKCADICATYSALLCVTLGHQVMLITCTSVALEMVQQWPGRSHGIACIFSHDEVDWQVLMQWWHFHSYHCSIFKAHCSIWMSGHDRPVDDLTWALYRAWSTGRLTCYKCKIRNGKYMSVWSCNLNSDVATQCSLAITYPGNHSWPNNDESIMQGYPNID